MQSKSAIRKAAIERRKLISAADRKQASQVASYFLAASTLFKQAQHIGCYIANASEFETADIIQYILHQNKNCYLPVVQPEKKLIFAKYKLNDDTQINQYNISEPVNQKRTIPLDKLDIVILPLSAFDKAGNRLGAGAGYYDRTFAFKQDNKDSKPYMLGLAFEVQRVEKITADQWDIRLDAVITEKGLFKF